MGLRVAPVLKSWIASASPYAVVHVAPARAVDVCAFWVAPSKEWRAACFAHLGRTFALGASRYGFLVSGWAKILQAVRFAYALVMQGVVFGSRHYHKVFGAVVVANAVDVMNCFVRCNRATNLLRHDQGVLADIAALVGIGMTETADQHVAIAATCPAVPSRVRLVSPAIFWPSHMCGYGSTT